MKRLSDFLLKKQIGSGGFAEVWLAEEKGSGNLVVLKLQQLPCRGTQKQFMREAAVLARLSHPNIVKIYSHFVHHPYGKHPVGVLVLEYIEGDSLEKLSPLPTLTAWQYLKPIADALNYMHSPTPSALPVIHRDIKPANIIIERSGRPVLIDFGIIRFQNQTLSQTTTLASAAVTDGFSPPEQYDINGGVEPATDVYAFGATLYFALKGCPPTPALQRVQGNSVDFAGLGVLRSIIEQTLDLDPNKRPSMKDLISEIETALSSVPTPTPPPAPTPHAFNWKWWEVVELCYDGTIEGYETQIHIHLRDDFCSSFKGKHRAKKKVGGADLNYRWGWSSCYILNQQKNPKNFRCHTVTIAVEDAYQECLNILKEVEEACDYLNALSTYPSWHFP